MTGLSAASRGLKISVAGEEFARPVCQICEGALTPGLDLGHQPVADLILNPAQLNEPEVFYPMRLHHCEACGLCQLGYTVDPAVVYKDFPFVSGTTQTATRHLQSIAAQMVERLRLGPESFAVGIGSNDGTLLKGYLPHGVRILGVDPSELPVRAARSAGIPTWHAFFNSETAGRIRDDFGPANAISAAGCFAHISDLEGVMTGVGKLLHPEGIFVTENQYWLDILRHHHYDNVFHQHLRNYSMRPLIRLHEKYGMEIFDVERSPIHGGSFRVFACRKGAHSVSSSVEALLRTEDDAGLYDPASWKAFEEEVQRRRRDLFDDVYRRVRAGQKVVGIGAPAKASTVCNYCRLGPDLISYITEINPLRVGKYLPGVHIPIVDEESLFTDSRPPGAAILFAWNYYDEVVPKLRARGFAGEVLRP